jgi:hypothetical protein
MEDVAVEGWIGRGEEEFQRPEEPAVRVVFVNANAPVSRAEARALARLLHRRWLERYIQKGSGDQQFRKFTDNR